jgi:hypothetical protein
MGGKVQGCERWEGKKEKWTTRVERMRRSLIYAQEPMVQLVDKRRRTLVLGALMRAVFTLSLDWHSSCHEVHHSVKALRSRRDNHTSWAPCPTASSTCSDPLPGSRGPPISQGISSGLRSGSVDP